MRRAASVIACRAMKLSRSGWAALLAVVVLGVACHEEPTIVIKFEPSDMSGMPAASPRPVVAPSPTPSPAPVRQIAAGHECKVTADCVVEPEDCCDCANGGRQHAIPKSKLAASKLERAKKCKGQMCTLMLSLDPTCGKRPDCVTGSCVMVDKPVTKTK